MSADTDNTSQQLANSTQARPAASSTVAPHLYPASLNTTSHTEVNGKQIQGFNSRGWFRVQRISAGSMDLHSACMPLYLLHNHPEGFPLPQKQNEMKPTTKTIS